MPSTLFKIVVPLAWFAALTVITAVCFHGPLHPANATFNFSPTSSSITRIIGADDIVEPFVRNQVVDAHSSPHVVAIFVLLRSNHTSAGRNWFGGTQLLLLCTGTIIDEWNVITAAGCVDGVINATIYAGAHDLKKESEPHRQVRMAVDFKLSPDSIACLIKLTKPLILNTFVAKTVISRSKASDKDFRAGGPYTLLAWGEETGVKEGVPSTHHFLKKSMFDREPVHILQPGEYGAPVMDEKNEFVGLMRWQQ